MRPNKLIVATDVVAVLCVNRGRMYGCLMNSDRHTFWTLCRNGTIGAALQAVIWETMLWIQRETGADCAAKVENNLIDRIMSNSYFYVVPHVDARIQDFDQRIGSDVYGIFYEVRKR